MSDIRDFFVLPRASRIEIAARALLLINGLLIGKSQQIL